MNLRYENLYHTERIHGVEKPVLALGHGQIEHARITVLSGPDQRARQAFFDIIAQRVTPHEGRLTYGERDKDGRWLYHPGIPSERLTIIRRRQRVPFLRFGQTKQVGQRGSEQCALLRTALAGPVELLLLDELSEATDEMTVAQIDDLVLAAQRDKDLTVILTSDDPARIARLGAEVLTFANTRIVEEDSR